LNAVANPQASEEILRLVPRSILDMAEALGGLTGLPPHVLICACLTVLGAATGNAAALRVRAWRRTFNGAIQCLLLDPDRAPLLEAIEWIVQPLSDLQVDRLGGFNGAVRQRIEEQIAACTWRASHGSPLELPEASAELRSLQLQLRPVLLTRDPSPGQLTGELARSGDGALLAIYSNRGWNQLLKAPEGKRSLDLKCLAHGWKGHTLMTGHEAAALEPAVSALIVCHSYRQLLEVESQGDRVIPRMLVAAGSIQPGGAPALHWSLDALDSWSSLLRRLDSVRVSGGTYLVELDEDAEELLLTFAAESRTYGEPEESLQAYYAPILAAKLSLALQLAHSQGPAVVTPGTMSDSIALTRLLVGSGVAIKRSLERPRKASENQGPAPSTKEGPSEISIP